MLPISKALYDSRTVRREQEPLHPSLNAMLRVQGQKSRLLSSYNVLYGSSAVIRDQELLYPRLNIVLNRQGLPHSNEWEQLKKLVHKSKVKFHS